MMLTMTIGARVSWETTKSFPRDTSITRHCLQQHSRLHSSRTPLETNQKQFLLPTIYIFNSHDKSTERSIHHRQRDSRQWCTSKRSTPNKHKRLEAHEPQLRVYDPSSISKHDRLSPAEMAAGHKKTHPRGILSFQIFFVSWGTKFEISVMIYPGDTEFALANSAHSTASDLQR